MAAIAPALLAPAATADYDPTFCVRAGASWICPAGNYYQAYYDQSGTCYQKYCYFPHPLFEQRSSTTRSRHRHARRRDPW